MANDYSFPQSTGDRTGTITATISGGLSLGGGGQTSALDGVIVNNGTNNFWFNSIFGVDVTNEWFKWDFGTALKVTGMRHYQSGNLACGNWKMQGSNDDTNWTDVSSTFEWGNSSVADWERLWTNTTDYRWYRLLGVSGSAFNGSIGQLETEFRISDETASPTGDILQTLNGFNQELAGSGGSVVDDEEDVVLIIIN